MVLRGYGSSFRTNGIMVSALKNILVLMGVLLVLVGDKRVL